MEWTWDISQWEWMQHLAVWPLAMLIAGIIGGFAYLSISDPVLPEDARTAEQRDLEQKAALDAATGAAPRHRA